MTGDGTGKASEVLHEDEVNSGVYGELRRLIVVVVVLVVQGIYVVVIMRWWWWW